MIEGKSYNTIRFLGHGKGGYSYLAECEGSFFTVKKIHHEPCDYYSFGNKIDAECHDYERLKKAGIRIPEMIAVNRERELIAKQYIEGETVMDLVLNDQFDPAYVDQAREMAELAKASGLNIDYFPTNFIVSEDLLWYVDYECNEYMDEWSFERWGIRYWSKTEELLQYVREHQGE